MSINFSDVGRIGKDAATRQAGNSQVTSWSIAVDSGFGDNKQTLWFDCSAWGDRWIKVSPYLTKGSQVFVQGEIGTREHEGKTYLTVKVFELKLVGGKQSSAEAPARSGRQDSSPKHADASNGAPDDDDIPFAPITRRSYL